MRNMDGRVNAAAARQDKTDGIADCIKVAGSKLGDLYATPRCARALGSSTPAIACRLTCAVGVAGGIDRVASRLVE